MEKNYYRPEYKIIIWFIFYAILLLHILNNAILFKRNGFYKTLPFNFQQGDVVSTRDTLTASRLRDKIVLQVDTLKVFDKTEDKQAEPEKHGLVIRLDQNEHIINIDFDEYRTSLDSVSVTLQDTLSSLVSREIFRTITKLDYRVLVSLVFNIIIGFLVFFSSYLLIKYSRNKENMLIAFFLIFLFIPGFDYILPGIPSRIWGLLISPFWGILFYHFIVIKTGIVKNLRKLYLLSTGVLIFFYVMNYLGLDSDLAVLWSAFWLLKGFLLLRREYKRQGTMELRRLLGALRGIGFSILMIIVFLGELLLIMLLAGLSSLTGLQQWFTFESTYLGLILVVLLVVPILGFFLGAFWFLGSLSWSLLTGTAWDVKVRSTLIYALVGFLFVTLFGMVDYLLGEILQHVFGKFMGSEFLAGIPVTIGLIAFFNPLKSKVENLVDKQLNSSELDFLEKTESFNRVLSEEGVLEGFEEYICDNLIRRLPVTKVAMISFDQGQQCYKFNEIRGSDVEENSAVSDKNDLLKSLKLQRILKPDTADLSDISSFALIIPVLAEQQNRWFLALGSKQDNSLYSKKDEEVLVNLVERIRLSLKFILAYEGIMSDRINEMMFEKEALISQLEAEVKRLRLAMQSSSLPGTRKGEDQE